MTKKIVTIAVLTVLFLTSCKETPKQEIVETTAEKTVEKTNEGIINATATDKSGNKIETSFDNNTNSLTLKLNGETIKMTLDSTKASGSNYKNDHYHYSTWHGKTTIEKDGKIIFEAGEATMPK